MRALAREEALCYAGLKSEGAIVRFPYCFPLLPSCYLRLMPIPP